MVSRIARCTGMLLVLVALAATACAPQGGARPGDSQDGGPAPTMDAQAVADFYRGKTITIVVGFPPGGGFDTNARLLANHIGNHIPGSPNVVVENMPGAGSLIGANHLYNVAKPDGLTFGTFNELQVLNQVTRVEGVEFDAAKFGWLGNAIDSTVACTVRADSPYKTAQDLPRRELPPLVVGGTGPGANTDDFPKLLNAVLGANIQLVSGYGGTSDLRLAVDSGEIHGMCWSWESVAATAKHWLDSNFIVVPIYQSSQRHEEIERRFPGAARAEDLATTEQDKQLIRGAQTPGSISKPFVTPPGVPAERLQALQQAFWATMQDPAFRAEAEQARVDLSPNPAARTQEIVNELLNLPPEVKNRLAEVRR
ncbi:MAG: hypothetical protein GEU73_12175 [Chloroflexi bacterium]|nr:hypothetical protein [Chloroflexota bacterium]